jgi:ubiquinone/menaquinone biosynthesis C-methylase UbiE
MHPSELYFHKLAAAFVRGRQIQGVDIGLANDLLGTDLELLTDGDFEAIFQAGGNADLRIHKFKRTMALPRVHRVFGILRSLAPTGVLDVGSGRGTFLWPLLDAFPDLAVLALDQDAVRARDIQAVCLGGIRRLFCLQMDATHIAVKDNAFPVVTMLEVLEHISDPQMALKEVVRVAEQFVIASVPSKEDNNPEHLHLFDRETLARMFVQAGTARVTFDYVPGHLIAVARVSNP